MTDIEKIYTFRNNVRILFRDYMKFYYAYPYILSAIINEPLSTPFPQESRIADLSLLMTYLLHYAEVYLT